MTKWKWLRTLKSQRNGTKSHRAKQLHYINRKNNFLAFHSKQTFQFEIRIGIEFVLVRNWIFNYDCETIISNGKLTLMSPTLLRSTLAELRKDGATRVCKRRSPLLFATSSDGNSVGWKRQIDYIQYQIRCARESFSVIITLCITLQYFM